MPDTGTPPVIPIQFQQYNSYIVDPQWQRKFSIIWPSFLAFVLLLSVPHLIRSMRNGRAFSTLLGISEDLTGNDYTSIAISASETGNKSPRKLSPSFFRSIENFLGTLGSIFYWTLPGIGLNAGQILILTAYVITVVLCIVLDAPLMSNSNRAGFIALAQFPIVFLFATKNSIVSLLLGPGNGYEKLNFIHRWSGRIMFLGGVLHGSLWIRNHLQYDIPILGQQKETSGVASLGLLSVIVLSSLRPVRRFCYEVFYAIHMLSFVAFFVTVCYHTIYASPWIFPPLAFYGLDILMRMFRHRIKDAVLVPVGNQMTLIHVPYSTSGWIAGQHVRLRVFFSGRIFESHPLSIFSAPPEVSCITSMPQGVSFGVRACGDWSKALNQFALQSVAELQGPTCEKGIEHKTNHIPVEVPIQVMLDGPYGGCSVDLGNYETALLFAGGSGITFTLGVLDDIVGRCVRQGRKHGEITRRIEFAWCVRSFGSIDWFAPALMDIANVAALSSASPNPLDLHISIYVTCLCNPEAIPPIPNCDVTIIRPSIYRVLMDLTTPQNRASEKSIPNSRPSLTAVSDKVVAEADVEVDESAEDASPSSQLPWVKPGGGLAVCASGPESLSREASNAVARLEMSGRGGQLGGIGLHTEVFTL
ncbi:hypothetical protein GALMADRAFT_65414 [Galerina marginata CBS 339.88]|uniref:ferric-chelate reductase (NADPH) n=1 Tax=Galerina marginata (strain CBS 339.88) TaxID=685588 RepID=A0A067T6E6_GALM3|nr:hypothetical protein GALMADRAFT_65414 [Galerina marginata CBS 339.88]